MPFLTSLRAISISPPRRKRRGTLPTLLLCALSCFVSAAVADDQSSIVGSETVDTPQGRVTTGGFRVFEDRGANAGRQIHLDYVILHSRSDSPQPDPIFFFAGGPGQAVISLSDRWVNHWFRDQRDVVLINQRGTGGDNHLAFEVRTTGNSIQQFIDPLFEEAIVRENRDRLAQFADLRMYSTPIAMDDINDVRKALGYEQINIMGGSYGTRACLVYLRRHGDTVRTATLLGCAPIEFRNPLYHSQGAQRALDNVFKEVASSDQLRGSFGDLKKKFDEIVERITTQPVTVEIVNQGTGKSQPVTLDRQAFLAAIRMQLYSTAGNRQFPQTICELHEGNFRPWIVDVLKRNVALRQSLAMGMLLSVTAAEDIARIDADEVEQLAGNTIFGSQRVKSQMAAAALWPKSELPVGYSEPVHSRVPTLIFSGSIDPVTPPKWGEMIHQNFPNSLHLVVPTAHDIGGPCIDQVQIQFLNSASIKGLDHSCINEMTLPPLVPPGV